MTYLYLSLFCYFFLAWRVSLSKLRLEALNDAGILTELTFTKTNVECKTVEGLSATNLHKIHHELNYFSKGQMIPLWPIIYGILKKRLSY